MLFELLAFEHLGLMKRDKTLPQGAQRDGEHIDIVYDLDKKMMKSSEWVRKKLKNREQKNAGLKSATLISVFSPVSQVLW